MTIQSATKNDKGKTCICGHVIWVIRGKVTCYCNNPKVWKTNLGYHSNAIQLTNSNSDR